MLLPTARVRLTYTDRGKIGLPLLTGLGMATWKLIAALGWALMTLLDDFTALLGFVGNPIAAFWAVATGAVGYGTKSYFAYQGTRQRYNLTLTESLYFGTLDSNAGVLFRLLDEAEEQECREAILAYFFLWRYAGDRGWTAADLDDYIELHLERYAKLKVDFEIGDAMEKLEKARLVEKRGDRYVAIPITKGLEVLDWAWDNYFKYNNPEYEAPPV
jgi:hypothetical protein